MRVRILDIHPYSSWYGRRQELIGSVVGVRDVRAPTTYPGWSLADGIPNTIGSILGRFEEVQEEQPPPSPQRPPRPGDRIRITEVSHESQYYGQERMIGLELTIESIHRQIAPGMYAIRIPEREMTLLRPPGSSVYGCRFDILEPNESQSVPSPPTKEPTMLDKGLLMLPDGNTYRATFTRLSQATVDETLKKVAGSGYQRIEGAFTYEGNPVTLCQNATHVVAGVDIKSLNINARYRLIGDAMVPIFVTTGDGVNLNCTWTPPAGCILRVAISCKVTDGVRGIKDVFLFARTVSGEPGGFFRLPLPNTFADGRMCMGNTFRFTVPSGTVEGLLAHAINHLNVSPWGTDMMPEEGRLRAMFRFDPSALTNLPITGGEWHSHCQRCSRVELDAQFA